MAKGKHTAALFEVFHGTRILDPRGQAALKTPGWWFKGRESDAEASAVDPNDPTTQPIKSGLIAPHAPATEQPVAASDSVGAAEHVPSPVGRSSPAKPTSAAMPARGLVRRDTTDPTRFRGAQGSMTPSAPRFEIDNERREVLIRLRVTTAIVSAFVIVVTIGFAYILGRKAASGLDTVAATDMVPASTTSTQGSALDVARRQHAVVTKPRLRDDSVSTEAAPGVPMANTVNGLVEDAPEVIADDGPRVIGVNYVIAQSYPSEQTADEARDFLVQHGISCTVEKAPAGWPSKWFSVVTRHGFEHIHTADCENYKKQIQQLGEKFASKGQFKHFAPFLYAWKG